MTTTKNIETLQAAARVAHAAYDVAYGAFLAATKTELGELSNDATEGEAEAYWDREEAIRERFEIDRLSDIRREAERELVEAAVGEMQRRHPERANELGTLLERWYLPTIRERLVDLCQRASLSEAA